MSAKKMRLGDLLVDAGKLTHDQLMDALKRQKKSGKKTGELLVHDGYVTERDIIEALDMQLGIPHIDLNNHNIDGQIVRLVPENLAKKHVLIPYSKKNNKLLIAMADPLNILAIDDVKMATGLEVEPAISTKRQIINFIEVYYGNHNESNVIEEFNLQEDTSDIETLDEDIIKEINNAPIVRLVNSIIKQAVKSRASDIHIEPFEKQIRVRVRVDGELQEIMTPPKTAHSAIVTRIKIMGNMNIAEKRVPQDGRIEFKIEDKEIDLRISVLPTVFGEKVVIRLLDRTNFLMSKQQLGFTDVNLTRYDNLIKNPYGILLVTGPTGSGKTTTLYTALREINTINKNIITVEDPVEYRLHGINQVQVNYKAGLTFANGLRSILRQDPDIIMIGEIRDAETAAIAVRAAITGHLVISTMHTNNAPATVSRIVDMGIEPYLISASLSGVIAQRLVRKICDKCKTSYVPSQYEMEILDITDNVPIFKGQGCSECYDTGYKGRTAIHEIMNISNEMKSLIDRKAGVSIMRETAIKEGMITLRENCRQLVLDGITTVDELIRVTYNME